LVKVKKNSVFKVIKTDWKNNLTIAKNKRNIWSIALIGQHQLQNAEIAYKALMQLKKSGFKIKNHDIKKAFENAKIRGRMQILHYKSKSGKPVNMIIDSCHNLQAVESFIKTYSKSPFKNKKSCLLFSIAKDKECKKIIKILAKNFDNIILCQISKRSLNTNIADKLFKKFNPAANVETFTDFNKAFSNALNYETMAAVGSFYLSGAVLEKMKK
jgi:dihydrofolate synthase/folylpolyglutamate synthase